MPNRTSNDFLNMPSKKNPFVPSVRDDKLSEKLNKIAEYDSYP